MPVSSTLRMIFTRRMLTCLLIGFSSGLPLYVLFQLIPLWLRDEGVGLAEIGLATGLLTAPYNFKFLWSPLLDRYVPPLLGRRRGWALITQLGLFVAMLAFAFTEPKTSLPTIAALMFIVCLFSATQDIALDAYRREILSDRELGFGTSLHVSAYRVAQLIPGLGFIIAEYAGWFWAHTGVAAMMFVGMLASLFGPEPETRVEPPKSLREAVVGPIREFFSRGDIKATLPILAFLFLYKIGDNMATALIWPFYTDIGFSKLEIGSVVKSVTLFSTVGGVLVGGLIIHRIGINKSLWCFGCVQMASILGFAWLSEVGHDIPTLIAVVAFEYIGVGLGTSAFLAFVARMCHRSFTATQFALFSAIMSLPRTVSTAMSGFLIEDFGYTAFFLGCFVIAIPGMLLLFVVAPWRASEDEASEADDQPAEGESG